MGDEAKSGTHLAAAILALTFFFWSIPPFRVQFTLNSILNGGVLQKKKVNTCFAAPFVSLSAKIVIELEFLVIMSLLTGINV